MLVEYFIIGGCLKIQKSVFIQEMLVKDSLLRALLNWKGTQDFSIKHPRVDETGPDQMVTIRFDTESRVSIGESPKELLGALKAKYKSKIKGKIACRYEYSTFGGMFSFEIGLDSEDGEIEYIMN